MNAIQILENAKAALRSDTWAGRPDGDWSTCLALSVGRQRLRDDGVTMEEDFQRAYIALLDVIVPDRSSNHHDPLWKFNDAPGRTLAEIHAKIDEAIALLASKAV